MCIRDSDRTGLVVHLRHPAPARAGPRRGPHHHRGEAHPDPCLLYTSDAADERSSVDLGGRRIIKKKNSQVVKLCRRAINKQPRMT